MKSTKANKLIDKMQRDLQKNGFDIEGLVEDLKNLRVFAVDDKEPAMAKLIRLAIEHLDEFEAFNIPIPPDELSDEDDEMHDETEVENISGAESMDYMLSLMLENDNKFNKEELTEYRDLLLDYEEEIAEEEEEYQEAEEYEEGDV